MRKKRLAVTFGMSLLLSMGVAANASAAGIGEERFQPSVTYDLSVTDAERDAIHAEVEALAGRVSNARAGDGTYDPLTLIGAMLDGATYDSISRGGTAATAYPFPVSNTAANQNEYDRKVAKLAWVVKLATDLGFPVVVQRQPDKYVYAEIGDPDAPEMVMALSHLDSPTASVSAAQLARWRDPFGNLGTPGAYHSSYIKDSWVYGAGIQDDSGPTLATLLAAKAMLEAGLPIDRRVRIVMGIYEDGGPGTPSTTNTATFQSIPYNSNPSFYDNWAYKNLNREETPVAAYTSDSRFPVIVGNSGAVTPSVSMSLSADSTKAFRLTDARAGVTLREGDPTLKDITYGSTTQIASRAIFTLDVAGAGAAERDRFVSAITAAATTKGWLPAAPGTTPKVQTTITGDSLTLEINTDVAMEMPTPQYGKNAVVWGMFLLSKGLGALGSTAADLQLKKAADGIADLFFRDGVEGEAYIGKYMGIPASLLRNPSNGTPNLTFALMGGINSETPTSFYTDATGSLSIPMFVRSMHVTAADSGQATAAVTAAFQAKGFTIGTLGSPIGAGLYVTHDNPLTALQFGSYQASINRNPQEFADPYSLRDVVFPQGTTGGTLASNFRNKMTAFGAVIPGNERWWHTANERMKVDSAVQMTKMMADGMLEMARYSGPAGAKFMWAEHPGAERRPGGPRPARRHDRNLQGRVGRCRQEPVGLAGPARRHLVQHPDVERARQLGPDGGGVRTGARRGRGLPAPDRPRVPEHHVRGADAAGVQGGAPRLHAGRGLGEVRRPRLRRLQVQHSRRRHGCAAGRSCGAECGQVLLLTHLGHQPRRPLPVGQPRDHRCTVHRGAGHPRRFQDGPVHGQSDVLGLEPGSVPRARGHQATGLLRVR